MRFLTVSVSKVVDGPAIVIGSGFCRCDAGTGHKYGVDVFGIAGKCPIKSLLVQADNVASKFPEYGQVQIKLGAGKDWDNHQ